MNLVSKDDGACFKAPYDHEYNPLKAYANGHDIYNVLCEWELGIESGKIVLSNHNGAFYDVGELTLPAVRCSLAFFQFNQPIIAITYWNGESVIYSYNLDTKELKTLTVFSNYKDVSILYARQYSKDKLLLAAIHDDSLVVGEINVVDKTMLITSTNELKYQNSGISRFGISSKNELKIEIIKDIQS